MLRTSILLIALAALPVPALAQAATEPMWDLAVTTGLFEGIPHHDDPNGFYGDDSYSAARFGGSIGRYWTTHLKTEVEVMTSTEGMHYAGRQAITADGTPWPYSALEYYRLSQGSARVVWQLLDNRWIHPYLLAGLSVDIERQRSFAAEQYRYIPSPPGSPAMRELLVREETTGPETVHRAGALAGGGAKFYMSTNAFVNAALIVSYARPARTVSFIIGCGRDF